MALTKVRLGGFEPQYAGRRNLIINGAMQVAQRGTSSTALTGYNVCDRWQVNGAVFNFTTTQNTLTSSDTPYQYGFRNSLKTENTSAGTGASSYQLIRQRIEAQNVAQSGWDYTNSTSYLTLSFWVKSSLAGTYYYHIRTNDGTAQMFISSVTLSSNVWKKVELSMPGNSNITINNDTGEGLNLNWYVHLGTTYSGSVTLDDWVTYDGNAQTPDYTQDWGNTLGATFELTGVQLEVGSVATPFEQRSFVEELALCQRYHYRITGNEVVNATDGGFAVATNWDGHTFFITLDFPTQMRAGPSMSYGAALSDFLILQAGATNAPTGISLNGASKQRCEMNFTKSGGFGSAGTSAWVRIVDNTNGFVAFDSEF
jgi:hypothetical protein